MCVHEAAIKLDGFTKFNRGTHIARSMAGLTARLCDCALYCRAFSPDPCTIGNNDHRLSPMHHSQGQSSMHLDQRKKGGGDQVFI